MFPSKVRHTSIQAVMVKIWGMPLICYITCCLLDLYQYICRCFTNVGECVLLMNWTCVAVLHEQLYASVHLLGRINLKPWIRGVKIQTIFFSIQSVLVQERHCTLTGQMFGRFGFTFLNHWTGTLLWQLQNSWIFRELAAVFRTKHKWDTHLTFDKCYCWSIKLILSHVHSY